MFWLQSSRLFKHVLNLPKESWRIQEVCGDIETQVPETKQHQSYSGPFCTPCSAHQQDPHVTDYIIYCFTFSGHIFQQKPLDYWILSSSFKEKSQALFFPCSKVCSSVWYRESSGSLKSQSKLFIKLSYQHKWRKYKHKPLTNMWICPCWLQICNGYRG